MRGFYGKMGRESKRKRQRKWRLPRSATYSATFCPRRIADSKHSARFFCSGARKFTPFIPPSPSLSSSTSTSTSSSSSSLTFFGQQKVGLNCFCIIVQGCSNFSLLPPPLLFLVQFSFANSSSSVLLASSPLEANLFSPSLSLSFSLRFWVPFITRIINPDLRVAVLPLFSTTAFLRKFFPFSSLFLFLFHFSFPNHLLRKIRSTRPFKMCCYWTRTEREKEEASTEFFSFSLEMRAMRLVRRRRPCLDHVRPAS